MIKFVDMSEQAGGRCCAFFNTVPDLFVCGVRGREIFHSEDEIRRAVLNCDPERCIATIPEGFFNGS